MLITFYYFYKDQSLRSLSFSTDQYLSHYWPIKMGKMLDEIGSAHMTQGALTSFIEDRFGCPYSALALNGGWTQVPPGIYFDTQEFTILVWVQQVDFKDRVLEFNPFLTPSHNFILRLDFGYNNQPGLNIIADTGNSIGGCQSNQALLNATWQFLAATFNGTNSYVYLNGELTNQKFYTK